MEQQNIPQEEQPKAADRPVWQRIGALVCVVIMVVGFALYCWHIANGGI